MISKLWHGWRQRRRVTAAWGCAIGEDAVHLVALGGSGGRCWRVLGSLQAPLAAAGTSTTDESPAIDAGTLRETLRAPGVRAFAEARHCALSLPPSRCVQGHASWPALWSQEEVAAQVMVEAAAALNLAPHALGFDYAPDGPTDDETVQRWRWAACARSELRPLRRAFRAVPLQLFAVEPAESAAQRAWQHLREGSSALWSLAVTDWHFEPLPQRDGALELPGDVSDYPQLVACGLALAPLVQAHAQHA